MAPRNTKVIVALMNIQALSHLDLQGTAMIPTVGLLKVLVTREKLKYMEMMEILLMIPGGLWRQFIRQTNYYAVVG